MLVHNANFEAANSAASKSLRLVIAIHFDDSNVIYFTSHDDITISGETTVDGVLRKTSSTSQRIDPNNFNATIGGISFENLDFNESVTDVFREQLQDNDNGLKGKTVELYVGYEGLDWDDYVLKQTQKIDRQVTYMDKVYNVSCRDIQREARKNILEPKKTRLSATLPAGDTTVEVFSTNGWGLVPHGTSYSLDPSVELYYFKIKRSNGYEICSATGKTDTSFTGVTRGLFGTEDQLHEVGSNEGNSPEVTEYIYLEMPAVKLAYALLTGDLIGQSPDVLPEHYHLGVATEWVDLDSFTDIGTDLYDSTDDTVGRMVRFEGLTKTDGKRFIEQQILSILGSVMIILPNGKLSLKRIGSVQPGASYVAELNETNVVKYSALKYDLAAVRNILNVYWGWLELQNGDKDFYRRNTYVDGTSIIRNEIESEKDIRLYGLHSERHTSDLIQSMFSTFRNRVAGPPINLTLDVLPSLNNLEVGDIVRVNLPYLHDHTGINILDRAMEIQGITVNQLTQAVSLQLYGSTQPASLLTGSAGGNSELPDNWYCQTGTNLDDVATITAGSLAADVTLTGGDTMSEGIYFYEGDLTIPFGRTLTLEDNVYLRVRGFFQNNGTINGQGNGHAAVSSSQTGGDDDDYRGEQGFIGQSRGGGSVYSVVNGFRCERGILATGLFEEFPNTVITNNAGVIEGLYDDLRGVPGPGGLTSFDNDRQAGGDNATLTNGPGGVGGNGGAGLRIVCRGFGIGANGLINLSGDDGSQGAFGGGAGISPDGVFGGTGGGGGPGALDILIDGINNTTPPLTTANFQAELGDSPPVETQLSSPELLGSTSVAALPEPASSYYRGFSSFNYGLAAASVRYVPASETTYPIFVCGPVETPPDPEYTGEPGPTLLWDEDLHSLPAAYAYNPYSNTTDGTDDVRFSLNQRIGDANGWDVQSEASGSGGSNATQVNLYSKLLRHIGDGGKYFIEFDMKYEANHSAVSLLLQGNSAHFQGGINASDPQILNFKGSGSGYDFGSFVSSPAWCTSWGSGDTVWLFIDFDNEEAILSVNNTLQTAVDISDITSWVSVGAVVDTISSLEPGLEGNFINPSPSTYPAGTTAADWTPWNDYSEWLTKYTPHFFSNDISDWSILADVGTGVPSLTQGSDDSVVFQHQIESPDITLEDSDDYTLVVQLSHLERPTSFSSTDSIEIVLRKDGANTSTTMEAFHSATVAGDYFGSGIVARAFSGVAAEDISFSVRADSAYDQDWSLKNCYLIQRKRSPYQYQPRITFSPESISSNVANGSHTTATVTPSFQDITPATYLWTRVSGSADITIDSPSDADTEFSSDGEDIARSAVFRLRATDADGNFVEADYPVRIQHGQAVTITPSSINETLANGPDDTTSVTAAAANMSGTITYAWTRVSGDTAITPNSPNAATTSFASSGTNTTRSATFRVTATDENNDTAVATIVVNTTHQA